MKPKLTAVIIDDEKSARENLRLLLESFCQDVEVLGVASNVDDAVILINNVQPQVVFLDIEMPEKNGFQLLDEFSKINFQIIFVTAYDHYALKAFQVAALDYLLKPIEIDLLQKAVKKIAIHPNNSNERLELLSNNRKEIKKIAIPFNKDFKIINIQDIICIEADRMYSTIYTLSGKKYVAAKKLMYYEKLLKDNDFFRVHRSWIVNLNHIKLYAKVDKLIKLSNSITIPIGNGYKEELENMFKK